MNLSLPTLEHRKDMYCTCVLRSLPPVTHTVWLRHSLLAATYTSAHDSAALMHPLAQHAPPTMHGFQLHGVYNTRRHPHCSWTGGAGDLRAERLQVMP